MFQLNYVHAVQVLTSAIEAYGAMLEAGTLGEEERELLSSFIGSIYSRINCLYVSGAWGAGNVALDGVIANLEIAYGNLGGGGGVPVDDVDDPNDDVDDPNDDVDDPNDDVDDPNDDVDDPNDDVDDPNDAADDTGGATVDDDPDSDCSDGSCD